MSSESEASAPSTRRFLTTSAAALGMALLVTQATATAEAADATIRPFQVHVPEQTLNDLRQRIQMTRWPDRETVKDQTQGVQLHKIKPLVEYWGSGYDWRKAEAKLNALPQFMTNIDGVDTHFIHVKSKHPGALPLLIVHGWPGSVFEMVKAIGPLTDPTAYGGKPEDAFDVVIPSMPGYGFSERPKTTGWGPARMGLAFDVLMKRLGYKQYVAQGGDWGSVVADVMATQKLAGLVGIHLNMPGIVPADIAKKLNDGDPVPAGLGATERAAYVKLGNFYKKSGAYGAMMTTRPQTIGYSLDDSPAGLAAFFYDKFAEWTYSGGEPERSLTRDEMLDDLTLTWVTKTGTSGARLYWENNTNNFNAGKNVALPTAITVFPGEIYQTPRNWAERAYQRLVYFNVVDKGGHFAAWEQPELFAAELRAGFKSMRQSVRAER